MKAFLIYLSLLFMSTKSVHAEYPEVISKVGDLTTKPRTFFLLERAALFENKARVKTKNGLRGRHNQKSTVEVT